MQHCGAITGRFTTSCSEQRVKMEALKLEALCFHPLRSDGFVLRDLLTRRGDSVVNIPSKSPSSPSKYTMGMSESMEQRAAT